MNLPAKMTEFVLLLQVYSITQLLCHRTHRLEWGPAWVEFSSNKGTVVYVVETVAALWAVGAQQQ